MYISKLLRKIDYRIIQIQHDISSFLGNMSLKRRLLNISCYEGHRYAFEIHQYT